VGLAPVTDFISFGFYPFEMSFAKRFIIWISSEVVKCLIRDDNTLLARVLDLIETGSSNHTVCGPCITIVSSEGGPSETEEEIPVCGICGLCAK
jgi:hypothetical protein